MKRLVHTAIGDPVDSVRLEEVPEPVPVGDQVLIRMEAAVVNDSDFLFIEGRYAVRADPPGPVGAEGVGRVVATGPDAVAHAGRRVAVLPTYEQGAWAELVATSAHNVVVVSDDADPLQLAMLPINPATAHLLLARFVDLRPGDWVGQTAANSAVGRYVLALARLRGLKTLNVVRRDVAAAQVREAGGDRVVIAGAGLEDRIGEALGGERLALVVDSVGGESLSALAHHLRFGGYAVNYAFLSGNPVVSALDLVFNEVRHTGFWVGNWVKTAERTEIVDTYAKLAEYVASGELSVPVEATYPLDDYRKAFAHAKSTGRDGKILFTF